MINYKEKYEPHLGLIQSPYDKRDYKFGDLATVNATLIPDNYTSKLPPFVYDQGQSSMCCACAYSSIRYMQEMLKEQSELTEPLSPCFTYGNRDENEVYEGMLLRECCKKGRDGSVLFSELPYFCSVTKAINYVDKGGTQLKEKAKPYAISSFYSCRNRKEIQTAIMQTQAVLIGIPVFDCFYSPDKDGKIKYNKNTCGMSNGGHAQAIFGWETDENGKLWWKSLNSWGKEWGKDGYSLIPEEYPWMDEAYVIVDEVTEMKFKEYKEKYKKDCYKLKKLLSFWRN